MQQVYRNVTLQVLGVTRWHLLELTMCVFLRIFEGVTMLWTCLQVCVCHCHRASKARFMCVMGKLVTLKHHKVQVNPTYVSKYECAIFYTTTLFHTQFGLVNRLLTSLLSPVMNHFFSGALSAVVTGRHRVYYSLPFSLSFVSALHFGAMIRYITGNAALLFVDDIAQSGLKCDVCVTLLVLCPGLHQRLILLRARWVINSQSRGAALVCHAVLKEGTGLDLWIMSLSWICFSALHLCRSWFRHRAMCWIRPTLLITCFH